MNTIGKMVEQSENEMTYWEKVANSKWGMYTTEIAKRAILKGCNTASSVTTALEIGCEGGRWSKFLSERGWNMVCTDVNSQTLAVCQKRIPRAKCILVSPNSSTLPFPDEAFELLLCIEVVDVIQSEWFIPESYRVLNKMGLVVGVFWNFSSFRGLFYRFVNYSKNNKLNYYQYSYQPWRKKLLQSGFKVVYEEGYCWFPFSRSSNSSLVDAFTRLERFLKLYKLLKLSPWIVFVAQKTQ